AADAARPAHLPHGPGNHDEAVEGPSHPEGRAGARDRGLRPAGRGDAVRSGRMDTPARDAAADAPAWGEVDVQHRLLRAGRADRPRLGPAARDLLPRTHLR